MSVASPSPASLRISIALVTRNRPESLRRCLASWARQSVRPAEIIVSDDSDSEYAGAVADAVTGAGARLIRGPRRGLYANRNHVALHCTGTHLLSADDDHEHPVDYLEQVVAAVCADAHAVWCMGEAYDRAAMERAQWVGPGQMTAKGVLGEAPDEPARCWAIADGATLYPRRIFDSGLQFFAKPKFGDCYKEFGCLLHSLGYRIRPLRTTGVLHHMHEVGRSFAPSREETAAAMFAMLMFSFHYQPARQNQRLTMLQIVKLSIRSGLRTTAVLPRAIAWFRERKFEVERWQRASTERGNGPWEAPVGSKAREIGLK
jgi:GT2 family glycosyltransferase